jgi:hypothetical protein
MLTPLAATINEQFRQHIESLHPSFEALLSTVPFQFASLPKALPKAGNNRGLTTFSY